MAQSLVEIAKRSINAARSPHIVGAGVGAKQSGKLGVEPRLTLLVDAAVPKEELISVVKRAAGGGKAPDFDVIEVGDVKALRGSARLSG